MEQIKITLVGREDGNCKTIFRSVEPPYRYFNRIEADTFNCWFTCFPSQGYFENSSEVSNDILFEIVDFKGNALFTEGNSCLGSFCSIDRKARQVASEWMKRLHLKPHNEWREFLAAEQSAYGDNDYLDNWLYCNYATIFRETQDAYEHLGQRFRIVSEIHQHDKCPIVWEEVFIENRTTETVEKIIGYSL